MRLLTASGNSQFANGRACLSVRLGSEGWFIDGDPTLTDLAFPQQSDAQRLAMGLARRGGGMVQVYDRANRLCDTYV